MYDTLILKKPGVSFCMDDMEQLAREAAVLYGAHLSIQQDLIVFQVADSFMEIDYNDDEHVMDESQELATEYGLSCSTCDSRFEINGKGSATALSNIYSFIINRLSGTGKFIILNQSDGTLVAQ